MKDEEIIGKEFEGVEFNNYILLNFSSNHVNCIGKVGVVKAIHHSLPYCKIRFQPAIGKLEELWYPTDIVKQQIDERTPVDIDQLFKDIRAL